jgi:hypothetical protein
MILGRAPLSAEYAPVYTPPARDDARRSAAQ